MNELRRKIVLGTPLFTAGVLVGCGGGNGNESASSSLNADSRATVQATTSATGQSLRVSASATSLDAIWGSTYGGAYLAPNSSSPLIQTVVNGTALILTLVEPLTLADGSKAIRSLTLTLDNGAAPALYSTYTTSTSSGFIPTVAGAVRVLLRTSTGDSTYRYALNTYNNATVKVSSVGGATDVSYDGGRSTASTRPFGLTFTNLKFDPASGSKATTGIVLGGTTTLNVLPAETAAWL